MITDFSSITMTSPLDHSLIERLAFQAHRRETMLSSAGVHREPLQPAWRW